MFTFTESFYNQSFQYTSGVQALKEYILDILNTDRGSRPYYPDYGMLLDKYKYSLLTPYTAQQIHAEVFYIISSLDGISIRSTAYRIDKSGRSMNMIFNLIVKQEPIGLHLDYSDGSFV